MDAQQIIDTLGLRPHPEGGYFSETYRSETEIPRGTFGEEYSGARPVSTAIYYLLTPDTFSALHRLKSAEIFHHYLGSPVEMLRLWPDGAGDVVTIGPDIIDGMHPQVVVPQGVWQGSRLVRGGEFALLGCTVAPGFEYADYEEARRDELLYLYPAFEELIRELARL